MLFLLPAGDRDYIFEKLPPFLAGGLYIGSRTWPKAGTWTIHYQAPTILYVWVEKGDYNGGVDDALRADGWICEDVGGFQRANAAGSNPLGVWSRHFVAGSSYSSLEKYECMSKCPYHRSLIHKGQT